MAKLAIKGHETRGEEIIKLLEMFGGWNYNHWDGKTSRILYFINGDMIEVKTIRHNTNIDEFNVFTLEEFLEKYPYKVGDKVKVCGDNLGVIISMRWEIDYVVYKVKLSKNGYETSKTSENLQPYKEETMGDRPDLLQKLKEYFENTPREVVEKEWHEYDKYNEIGPSVEEYLEYVSNIRQPQYPKTYEECCKVLGYSGNYNMILTTDIDCKLFNALYRLKVCRDAYWKIAGDWKPDWTSKDQSKFVISIVNKRIRFNEYYFEQKVLAFPTEEMRDAFYNNFKDLIESCKELL